MGRYADQPAAPLHAVGAEPPPFHDGLSTAEHNRMVLTALSDDPAPAREWHAARDAWAVQYVIWAAANGLLTAREAASYERRGADAAWGIANDVQHRQNQKPETSRRRP